MMTISVCIGSACHLKGSYNVVSELQEMIEEHKLGDEVELTGVFCLGPVSYTHLDVYKRQGSFSR